MNGTPVSSARARASFVNFRFCVIVFQSGHDPWVSLAFLDGDRDVLVD
ncbi:MAG: hypothetical protein R2725_07165 [Solirubrobacterales bacterium]